MGELEYLESERQKIWKKLLEIESDVKKKVSDYESEAKQSSKKASEFRNKCESAKNEAIIAYEAVKAVSNQVEKSSIIDKINLITGFEKTLIKIKSDIDLKVTELEDLYENYDDYATKISNLEVVATSTESSSTKINAALDQVTLRKKELDQFYYEIFGSVKTDETTSKEIKIIGRREELNKAYQSIKSNFDNFKKDEVDDVFADWEKRFNTISQKVESLLPNALTAGLSHAHSDKKAAELLERNAFSKTFQSWIWLLIIISLIPFAASAYLIYTGTSLVRMLELLPRLVFSILPLYIPPLWVAISASKKMNLSKRLIEEYTHKEVVAKTFEGLSKQIEGIKDTKTSSDLKAKLLNNILQISIDNPGHLISDYNKSDHPFIEKLNNFFSRKENEVLKPLADT